VTPGEVPSPCRIYRILHFDNLAGIVEQGGMWCGSEMEARAVPYTQIGLKGLTSARKNKAVLCGPGGDLCDYVPWHFCPRSVMLFQIATGRSDYAGGQEPVLHLVTTVEKIESMGLRYVFTDRHAKTSYAKFFDDRANLGELDWQTIASDSFARTESDPDRPYRKEAEFLVYRFVPLVAIVGIGVHSQRWKDDCDRLISAAGFSIPVKVHTRWYY